MSKYYVVAYDDIGRVVLRTGNYFRTAKEARSKANTLLSTNFYGQKIESASVMKVQSKRKSYGKRS